MARNAHHEDVNIVGYIAKTLVVASVLALPWVVLDYFSQLIEGVLPQVLHHGNTYNVAMILKWASWAWLTTRIVSLIAWELYYHRGKQIVLPKLLRAVVSMAIYIGYLLTMLANEFDVDLTGMLTATGALGLIVGFALRSTIADVFAGLSINLERPFKLGDVIEVPGYPPGTVRDMNWRSTCIETRDREFIIIPNDVLTTMAFKNLSMPDSALRQNIFLHLDYSISTERALRILNGAVANIEQVLPSQPARVFVNAVDDIGVQYRICVFAKDFPSKDPLVSETIHAVMRNLYQAGIEPVHRKLDIYTAKMPKRDYSTTEDAHELLPRVDAFASLNNEEIEHLAASIRRHKVTRGLNVVKQGDEGDSLFILVEGALVVRLSHETSQGIKRENVVGRLMAGDNFGEMSLLTGEARSATVTAITDCVVYEIKQEDLAPLFDLRPELVDELSNHVAARRMASEEFIDHLETKDQLARSRQQAEYAKSLRVRIVSFFRNVSTRKVRTGKRKRSGPKDPVA